MEKVYMTYCCHAFISDIKPNKCKHCSSIS
jgi:hypothetical protein